MIRTPRLMGMALKGRALLGLSLAILVLGILTPAARAGTIPSGKPDLVSSKGSVEPGGKLFVEQMRLTQPPGIVTFANFVQEDPGNQWAFIGDSYPGTAQFGGFLTTRFRFLEDLDGSGRAPVGVDQRAELTFYASTSEAAFQEIYGSTRVNSQRLSGKGNFMSFTRLSDGANLLTAEFVGDFIGIDGTSVGSLVASSLLPSQMVQFTSDFIDFSLADTSALSLSFTSIIPRLRLAGASGASFLADFTAAATGTFDGSIQAVPEPSSLAIGVLALGGLLGFSWRRRLAQPGVEKNLVTRPG